MFLACYSTSQWNSVEVCIDLCGFVQVHVKHLTSNYRSVIEMEKSENTYS